MIYETLQELGLSPNEAKIYEALLDLNESGVGEISSKAKVHRRNAYDAISRLIDKGLIFPILTKGENLYSPVDPDKLLELIKEKENNLNAVLPGLRKRYEDKKVMQEAYIYRGIEGFKNFLRDTVRVGEDVYAINGILTWFDPRFVAYSRQIIKELKRKKIKVHLLFNHQVRQESEQRAFGNNYRFLPENYKSTSTINIFGDYVVNYTGLYLRRVDDKGTMFIIRDKELADSYRTLFKFMWDACKK